MSGGQPSFEDANETRKDYMARMVEEGNRIVIPADDELQVDIDTEEQYAAFQRSWPIFERDIGAWFMDAPTYTESPSRSGFPCRHITVKLPFMVGSDIERIAWQAALGSDPVRELLSLLREQRGDEQPTLFVEKAA